MSRLNTSLVAVLVLASVMTAGNAGAQDPLYALTDKLGPVGSLEPDALLGTSVAMDGVRAVVGAPGTNDAFVFVYGPDGWELEAELLPPDYSGNPFDVEYNTFGHAVAISGDVIAIGDPGARISVSSVWYEEGAICVFRRSAAGIWELEQELTVYHVSYLGDTHYGASVAMSGDTIIGGAPDDTRFGEPNETGSAFVFTLVADTWFLEQRLTPGYQSAEDHFGAAVDVFADTAVVGAPDRDVLLWTDAGRAYVFTRSGGSWSQTADLTASDASGSDHFGAAVSVAISRVLVGAPDDNHAAGTDAGSAYLFTGAGSSWTQAAKLTAGDAANGDRFGAAVSVSSLGGAVIGAPEDNLGTLGIDAGSAYFFKPVTGVWIEDQKIIDPDGAISDSFGSSVALNGSYTLIGAPMDEVRTIENTGSAQLFFDDGDSWGQQDSLYGQWGFGLFTQRFGSDIAVDGDTMVIGVPDSEWRSVQVFVRDGDEWIFQQELLSQMGWQFNDSFGVAVAINGGSIVVGAPLGQISGFHVAGVAYVFVLTSTISGPVWELQQRLEPSDGADGYRFGEDVAIDGDTVMVGSPGRSGGGGVYLWTRGGSVWSEDAILEPADLEAGDEFGVSVALTGDFLAAGATGDDDAGDDAGAVVLFSRMGSVWTEGQKLTAADPQDDSGFGISVARDGATLITGANHTEISGQAGSGAAHVFVETGGVWSEQQRLTETYPNAGSLFGTSVAVSGDMAAVGSPGWTFMSLTAAGAAYVFDRAGSIWTENQALHGSPIELGARFGISVEDTPDGLLVSALLEDFLPMGYGAVYFYTTTLDRSDLAVTVTDGQSEVVPGTTVTYDIVVTNGGPDDALGATVGDVFPPELTGCSWTCVGTSGGVCTSGPVAGDISDTVDLPVGARLDYTAVCLVDPAAGGDLVNTVSATPPAGVADPNLANNTDIDTDTLTPLADLSIDKDDGTTEVFENQPTTYTIVVTNAGPSDAPGSPVIDLFPLCLANCEWTCTADPGAWCPAGSTGDIDNGVDLPVGTSATFLATCTVVAAYGQCSNTAEVFAQAGNGVVDPDLANNESTDINDVLPDPYRIFADGFDIGDTSRWSHVVP